MFWEDDDAGVPAEHGSTVIELSFALRGRSLPPAYAAALAEGLESHLSRSVPVTKLGVRVTHLPEAGHGWWRDKEQPILLSRRARLVLRLERELVEEVEVLSGALLRVGEERLRLESPQRHELVPAETLYAHRVVDPLYYPASAQGAARGLARQVGKREGISEGKGGGISEGGGRSEGGGVGGGISDGGGRSEGGGVGGGISEGGGRSEGGGVGGGISEGGGRSEGGGISKEEGEDLSEDGGVGAVGGISEDVGFDSEQLEREFMLAVSEQLYSLDIRPRRMLCGRGEWLNTPYGWLATRSLLVDGMGAHAGLRLQELGLGWGSAWGCGVFVPHKAVV